MFVRAINHAKNTPRQREAIVTVTPSIKVLYRAKNVSDIEMLLDNELKSVKSLIII